MRRVHFIDLEMKPLEIYDCYYTIKVDLERNDLKDFRKYCLGVATAVETE